MSRLHKGIWILPTLGRLEGFKDLVDSVKKYDPEARVVPVFSDGDKVQDECLEYMPDHWYRLGVHRDASGVEKINLAFNHFPKEEFYGLLSNDLVIAAPQSLSYLAVACPYFGLSYCPDAVYDKEVAGHPCVDGELVRALGWWAYPRARHNYIDLLLTGMVKHLGGAVYIESARFIHSHYTMGTSEDDEVYKTARDEVRKDIIAAVHWAEIEKKPMLQRLRTLYDAKTR